MILVTGGAGYIGSHVLLELAKLGEEVVVVDNLSTGHQESLLSGEAFVQCDLSDIDKLRTIFEQYRPESVMHFAAFINAPESVAEPLKYYVNNTANTMKLLQVCVEFGVKHFLFSSTAATYGSVGERPVTEDTPTNPLNPYGWSKLMTEQIIKDTCKASGMKYAILRYFNVAGADPASRIGQRTQGVKHLLRACMDAAIGKAPAITVYGNDYPTKDGTGVRDYIHVCDLASAHAAVLTYLRIHDSRTFNVGYGTGYSVLQVIEAVKKVTGKDLAVEFLPRRPGDAASVVADSTKLQTLTGWKPSFNSIEKIVTDAWNWEQNTLL
jgi:UDP-glucose 4-epimerase